MNTNPDRPGVPHGGTSCTCITTLVISTSNYNNSETQQLPIVWPGIVTNPNRLGAVWSVPVSALWPLRPAVAVAVLPADHAGAADDPSSCTFAAGCRPACSQLAGTADGWFTPNGAEQPTEEIIVTRTRPVR